MVDRRHATPREANVLIGSGSSMCAWRHATAVPLHIYASTKFTYLDKTLHSTAIVSLRAPIHTHLCHPTLSILHTLSPRTIQCKYMPFNASDCLGQTRLGIWRENPYTILYWLTRLTFHAPKTRTGTAPVFSIIWQKNCEFNRDLEKWWRAWGIYKSTLKKEKAGEVACPGATSWERKNRSIRSVELPSLLAWRWSSVIAGHIKIMPCLRTVVKPF